ncbi:MAG: ATP-dependent DNA helicase, partial [Bacilli bacterium]|nr:ATP-dependent DNA helicase [Bacilli bacterium]
MALDSSSRATSNNLMSKEKQYLTLSVHDLVDFLLRKGDIDNRVYNQETMLVGTKIHASFQKKQGNEYLSEVPLRETFDRPLGVITLECRADGIIVGGPFPIVDEIKSSVLPLDVFYEQQQEWHEAQAMCYALMYAHENNCEKMGVRLTYISQIDNSKKTHEHVYTIKEIEDYIGGLMDRYLSFWNTEFDHLKERNEKAKDLPFPFPKFRAGQRNMAKYVYSVASNGGTFLVEAPTGIGKTMSALFPSIKSFATGKTEKIFYLTAK